MTMKIAHARINEIGTISGGQAGDQTGQEVCIQEFYENDWTHVFRPKTNALIESIVKNAIAIKNVKQTVLSQLQAF